MSFEKESCMETFSGGLFYPLNPRSGDVRITDIAHALALTCRYKGHCRKFYSVAQHCVLMSEWLKQETDPRWLLLHDAAEAYLTDLPRPVKANMPRYKEYEHQVLTAVGEAFQLPAIDEQAVKSADTIMLATEARDLMQSGGVHWGLSVTPLRYKVDPWTWEESELRFLDRARELGLYKTAPGADVKICHHNDESKFRIAPGLFSYVCRDCARVRHEREVG